MNAKILILALCSLSLALSTSADPVAQQEGQVEIEKQRLVRFPDDADDQLHRQNDDSSNKNSTANDKENEAKRILAEINKINQALGYVKKQREEQYRLPPILDSSQYLFPKPAYHPFHSQQHQIAGSNGETLLVPSIRAVKFENDENRYVEYNEPTHTKQHRANNKHNSHSHSNNKNKSKKTNSNNNNNINEPEHYQQKLQLMTLNEYQDYLQQQQQNEQQSDTQFYYRPNQVYVPAPPPPSHHHKQDSYKHQQREKLPTHFMLPVRLYKLNKEEYTKKYAPQEYRVKGYKIVGDIDNFYARNSKPKQSGNKPSNAHHTEHKSSSAKYHLFFLPREVALSDVARGKPAKTQAKHTALESTSKSEEQITTTRDEKLKPHRGVQGNTKASNGTQSTRKRVSARPAVPTTPSSTTSPASLTNTKITPPPIEVSISAATTASPTASEGNFNQNTNKINSFFNRPALGLVQMNDSSPNAIKTAFQNIFKFPFRQEAKPNLEPVPLQTPQKTFYSTQSVLAPSNFFQTQQQQQQQQQEHNQKKKKPSNTNIADDYKWDDDNSSNSAAEEDDNNASSPEQSEKQLFGHFHAQKQETQKEALRQGGIIIQRLKVRKGGIAIAGPGGVATAGSGGTAIVGPGGYALTHPRSLTIAGPGAKVIAIPPNIDLKDALQRTNLNARTFPREGKIVATGPTVYYSPGAPSAELTE